MRKISADFSFDDAASGVAEFFPQDTQRFRIGHQDKPANAAAGDSFLQL